jgi:hypothetical protein
VLAGRKYEDIPRLGNPGQLILMRGASSILSRGGIVMSRCIVCALWLVDSLTIMLPHLRCRALKPSFWRIWEQPRTRQKKIHYLYKNWMQSSMSSSLLLSLPLLSLCPTVVPFTLSLSTLCLRLISLSALFVFASLVIGPNGTNRGRHPVSLLEMLL